MSTMSRSTDGFGYVRGVVCRLLVLLCLLSAGSLQVSAVGAKSSNVAAIRKESATFLKNFPDAEVKAVGKHGTPTFVTGNLYDFRNAATELNANAIRPGVDAILPLTGLSPENLQFKSHNADTVTFGGTTLIENDNWGNAANAGDIASAASTVGAFALNNGGADAAILVTLPPGIYTALATSSSGNSGLTLVELYEVP